MATSCGFESHRPHQEALTGLVRRTRTERRGTSMQLPLMAPSSGYRASTTSDSIRFGDFEHRALGDFDGIQQSVVAWRDQHANSRLLQAPFWTYGASNISINRFKASSWTKRSAMVE